MGDGAVVRDTRVVERSKFKWVSIEQIFEYTSTLPGSRVRLITSQCVIFPFFFFSGYFYSVIILFRPRGGGWLVWVGIRKLTISPNSQDFHSCRASERGVVLPPRRFNLFLMCITGLFIAQIRMHFLPLAISLLQSLYPLSF